MNADLRPADDSLAEVIRRVRALAESGLQPFDIAAVLKLHPAQVRQLLQQSEAATR